MELETTVPEDLVGESTLADAPAIEGFRLSAQQRWLWRSQPQEAAFLARGAVALEGPLDERRLLAALESVVRRHEILRTQFQRLPGMALPIQVVGEPGPVEWTHTDLASLPPEGQEAFLSAWLARPARPVAAIAGLPAAWFELAVRSATSRWLLVDLPAVCADAATLDRLVAELAVAYAGAPESPAAMQYADFAEWQHEWLSAVEAGAGKRHWSRPDLAVQAAPPPYAVAPGSFPPAFRSLATVLGTRLEAAAARLGLSPRALLLACWQALLGRLADSGEILSTAVAFPGRGYEELENAFGPFSRYLPVPGRPAEEKSLSALARELDAALEEAEVWQDYFVADEALAEGEERALPCGFEYGGPAAPATAGGIVFELARRACTLERLDLRLEAVRGAGDTLELTLHSGRGRYDPADLDRLAGQLATLAVAALEAPESPIGDLPLLTAAERVALLEERNATVAPIPAAAAHELFEAQAARTPEALALVVGDRALNYAELDTLAERVASALTANGVGPGSRVGLLVERSPEMAAAVLGVWKSGCSYVALDPDAPDARLIHQAEDAGLALVLAESPWMHRVPAGIAKLDLGVASRSTMRARRVPVPPEVPAFITYTSGSTGRPKGVWTSHRSVVNYFGYMADAFALDESDAVLQIPSLAFDAAVRDLIGPLTRGGAVVLVDRDTARDPRGLARALRRHRITCIIAIVPTLLRGLLDAAAGDPPVSSLRLLATSGEALRHADVAAARRVFGGGLEVVNQYGPTECTMTSSFHRVAPGPAAGDLVAIGRPIRNSRFYVLDRQLRPVPDGLVGELYIGGAGVTLGYFGAPDLTADRFVPDVFAESGARLYRTGDLVRWAGPNGRELEFLGRTDHQIKLRGLRVEPQEIAAVLGEHPALVDAAVVARELPGGEMGLVAYVVPDLRRVTSIPDEQRYVLPNQMMIAHRNRHETDFFYEQIFIDHVEFRHGVRLGDDAVVFDVGANIGLFTLFVHQVCERPRVFSFEPIPDIFAALRANVELYGLDVSLQNCGLSDHSGEVTFAYYPRSSCQSGYYPDVVEERRMLEAVVARQHARGVGELSDLLGAQYFEKVLEERMQAVPVDCALKTISQVMAEEGLEVVDLLKIDVEKSELDVLRGIRSEDWGKVRQIVIEGHDLAGRLEDVIALLRGHGYELVVEKDELLEETCLFNIYAFRDGRPQTTPELRLRPLRAPLTASFSVDELRLHASRRLPAALVPAAFIVLDELPRTPNGKLDRGALPSPELAGAAAKEGALEPRNQVEELLAGIWEEVLGLERVTVHDNFFEIGGHSLLATQVLARVQEVFAVDLPLRTIFELPTVAQIAASVESALAAENGLRPSALAPVPRDGDLPLSFAQQRHYFLHYLEGESALLNVWGAVVLDGELDTAALEAGVGEILRRHEVLRTTFPEVDGVPRQHIQPPAGFRLPVADLRSLPLDERGREAERRVEREAQRPFDLAAGPLFRALLLRVEDERHFAVVIMHHIVGDGWSSALFVRELAALYTAAVTRTRSPLPEPSLQYADFAQWQRQWMQGDVLQAQLSYWERQLAGVPDTLKLPVDKVPAGAVSFRHGRQPLICPRALTADLKALSRREGVTLFTTLLAAFQTLLHWFSGEQDVSVGSPIANRNRVQTEGMIGCFINALVLRARFTGDPDFRQILAQAREMLLGAYSHQDLPFEKLVEHLSPSRGQGQTPLFQVEFNFQNTPESTLELPGLTLSPLLIERPEAAKYDLILRMGEQDGELAGLLTYKSDLFEAETMARLAGLFEELLAEVAARPESTLTELRERLAGSDRERRAQRQQQLREGRQGRFKRVQRETVHESE